jgi:hypothetical protein
VSQWSRSEDDGILLVMAIDDVMVAMHDDRFSDEQREMVILSHSGIGLLFGYNT